MAVPFSCSQVVSPNVKMLFFMTISSAAVIRLVGMLGGSSCVNSSNHACKMAILWSISMFVYIDTASQVII